MRAVPLGSAALGRERSSPLYRTVADGQGKVENKNENEKRKEKEPLFGVSRESTEPRGECGGSGRDGPRAGRFEAGFKLKLEECTVGCSFLQHSFLLSERLDLYCTVPCTRERRRNRQRDGEEIRPTSFRKKSLQCNAVPCM